MALEYEHASIFMRYYHDVPSYSMLMVRTVVFYLFEDCFRQKIYDKMKRIIKNELVIIIIKSYLTNIDGKCNFY